MLFYHTFLSIVVYYRETNIGSSHAGHAVLSFKPYMTGFYAAMDQGFFTYVICT